METSLVTRVNELESLFEQQYSSSDIMVKSHVETILKDAGYEELENKNVYHRLNNNSIDIFGFMYKRKDQLYHANFKNLNEANNFLNKTEKLNKYDSAMAQIRLSLGSIYGAAVLGFTSNLLIHQFVNVFSSPVNNFFIPPVVGMFVGAAAYLKYFKNIPNKKISKLNKKLDDLSVEVAEGVDALKSAINE